MINGIHLINQVGLSPRCCIFIVHHEYETKLIYQISVAHLYLINHARGKLASWQKQLRADGALRKDSTPGSRRAAEPPSPCRRCLQCLSSSTPLLENVAFAHACSPRVSPVLAALELSGGSARRRWWDGQREWDTSRSSWRKRNKRAGATATHSQTLSNEKSKREI